MTADKISAAAKTNAATYLSRIPNAADPARRILVEYSGIAPDAVDAHIYEIRDKAWAVFPYGCIGSFSFLDLTAQAQDPRFRAVVDRLKAPGSAEAFLDVGCCFGHVIRQLIVEGIPGGRLYGTDLQPRFLDLGYELFRDRAKSTATFLAGDMLKEDDSRLQGLDGKVDIIYASAFFHLFRREGQVRVAKRMVRFLNPDNPGVMIFGVNGGPKVPGWEDYVLDVETWQQMCREVGEATGTDWRTETDVEDTDERITVRFAVYRAS
ncbi:uncharacterized protein THITE_2056534 [Thermothielavioides terrestris NRRL 8126]|uniref:Methyltransferase domain-containing protein n=2 Tax=Thermothielavioides terrestris TaxID=2587410 RepID=G2RCW9_THETT|nr:uncharacterized protein THITE_2056534 [Thermothielavioides terrestris NRRL 8126]AEO69857.1 hypothetical protein THITE_2056534 [Thermothielavioides terrestris NRRL 8126]